MPQNGKAGFTNEETRDYGGRPVSGEEITLRPSDAVESFTFGVATPLSTPFIER